MNKKADLEELERFKALTKVKPPSKPTNNPTPYPPEQPPEKEDWWPKNRRIRPPASEWEITEDMEKAAEKVGVRIERSTRKGKKLDAFDPSTGKKIASFGALGYGDYHVWQQMERDGEVPPGFAEMKRRLYRIRHYKHAALGWEDLTPGYLSYEILW